MATALVEGEQRHRADGRYTLGMLEEAITELTAEVRKLRDLLECSPRIGTVAAGPVPLLLRPREAAKLLGISGEKRPPRAPLRRLGLPSRFARRISWTPREATSGVRVATGPPLPTFFASFPSVTTRGAASVFLARPGRHFREPRQIRASGRSQVCQIRTRRKMTQYPRLISTFVG